MRSALPIIFACAVAGCGGKVRDEDGGVGVDAGCTVGDPPPVCSTPGSPSAACDNWLAAQSSAIDVTATCSDGGRCAFVFDSPKTPGCEPGTGGDAVCQQWARIFLPTAGGICNPGSSHCVMASACNYSGAAWTCTCNGSACDDTSLCAGGSCIEACR